MGGVEAGIMDSVWTEADTVNVSHSLDALPSWAITPIRDVLATQGLPREVIDNAGELDAALLATSLIDTVTIRTNATPELRVDLRDLVTGPSSPLTRALQPTVVLQGRLMGTRTIAPHGQSSGGGLVFAGLVALAVSAAVRVYRSRR